MRDPWISKKKLWLADRRAALFRAWRTGTREVCKAQHYFQRALQEDRQWRVQEAGPNKEDLVAAGRVKESWDHILRLYNHVRGEKSHPTREGLDQESVVGDEIYKCWPPARLKVAILVHPTEVNNEVTTEVGVKLVVRGLRLRRARGPSDMRVEDLKGWRKEAKR